MTEPLLATAEGRALADRAVPMPLNGHAPPEAIAHVLMWLVSPENTHMTGQVVFVDGGADATLRGEDSYRCPDLTEQARSRRARAAG
jgi:NAD(P)-dependent dehydrogenase (short-subunit alcohol dehydrogenase family)